MPTKLTDEQRVRAAVPDASCWSHGSWRDGVQMWKVYDTSYVHEGSFPLSIGYSSEEAWNNALQHPTVQAHERKTEHMADTPELPEMDGMEGTWRPLTTAPRDGTRILVDFGRIGVHCVAWTEGAGIEIWCVDDRKHGPFPLRGYVEPDIKGWMPIPAGVGESNNAPLTGPAMEAMVRACAEAVWQMYREPHNLTWDARKEQTFEAVAAVVVETQGALLERIRELEGRLRAATICPKCNFPVSTHWTNTTNGETGCSVSVISNPARDLIAHAESAEEIMCGNFLRADRAYSEHDHICVRPRGHASFCATTLEDPNPINKGCSWWPGAYRLPRAEAAEAKVRDLEAAAGAARAETLREMIPVCCSRCRSEVPLTRDFRGILMHRYDAHDYRDCLAGHIHAMLEPKGASK